MGRSRYPDLAHRIDAISGHFHSAFLFLFFLCEVPGQRFPSWGDLLHAGGNAAIALKRTAAGAIGYSFAV
jgi:hypothetical protein